MPFILFKAQISQFCLQNKSTQMWLFVCTHKPGIFFLLYSTPSTAILTSSSLALGQDGKCGPPGSRQGKRKSDPKQYLARLVHSLVQMAAEFSDRVQREEPKNYLKDFFRRIMVHLIHLLLSNKLTCSLSKEQGKIFLKHLFKLLSNIN